ncbi:MAG: PAS domain-containing protein, partial [Chitinophagaceae bacterium]
MHEVVFANRNAAVWLEINLSLPLAQQSSNSRFLNEILNHFEVNKTAGNFHQFSLFSLFHQKAFSITVQIEGDILEFYIEEKEHSNRNIEENEIAQIINCFEKIKEGFLLVKYETRKIVYANEYFLQLTGYKLNEIVDLPIYNLHPAKIHAEIKTATDSLQGLHKVETEVLPFKKSNGSLIYLGIYAFI